MAYVVKKIRFIFIWEQDSTHQDYIRPHWGKYNILTIISNQFLAIAYHWDQILLPKQQKFFTGAWMKSHILENHGSLCALYKAKENGDFRSEGDSPSFIYTIVNGLRNGDLDHPGWGSWGGRYVRVRENIWLDPVQEPGYQYPEGRWYSSSACGRQRLRKNNRNNKELIAYLKPIWRWADAFQNDFAARADWCIKSYDEANHAPVVMLADAHNLKVQPGDIVVLSANLKKIHSSISESQKALKTRLTYIAIVNLSGFLG
jgi:hypothetical protein